LKKYNEELKMSQIINTTTSLQKLLDEIWKSFDIKNVELFPEIENYFSDYKIDNELLKIVQDSSVRSFKKSFLFTI